MRIRRILHPTDFSAASGRAFKVAVQLARNRATLLLFHVLERLRLKAKAAGVRASTLLRDSSSPAQEIVRVARAKRVDLIVMGTHGRGGLAKVFLGSVAERVVRTATCPVLTVRGR